MNVALAAFNLLPGAPLDGGRLLRGLLWKRSGDRQRASRTAARSGQVLGIGISAIGVLELLAWRDIGGLWLMLIGWFLVTTACLAARPAAYQPASRERLVSLAGQAQLGSGPRFALPGAPGRTKVPGNRNFGPSIGRHRITC